MRSREASPLKDEEAQDHNDEDVSTAAEIPLPGSPTKGRSLSRSVSPTRQSMPTPESEVSRFKHAQNAERRMSSEPRSESQKNCMDSRISIYEHD